MNKIERKSRQKNTGYADKLLGEKTPFAVMEAFKTLRTNLLFTTGTESPLLGLTSCLASTGKSLISANIAIAFSMMNKRVLLIDCDMRKPVQHKCFGIENTKGASELFSGQVKLEEVVHPISAYKGLSLITAGRIPPNPQELLTFAAEEGIFEEFRKQYDVVIVDLPPVGVVSDAMTISKQLTGYLFITRAGESEKSAVKQATNMMRKNNCKVLGTVLNYADPKYGGKYHYYDYYQ